MVFAVEGYTSLYSLVSACSSKSLRDGEAKGLLEGISKVGGLKTAVWFSKYHPREKIIEAVTMDVAERLGLYLCTPNGIVLSCDSSLRIEHEHIWAVTRNYGDSINGLKSECLLDCLSFKSDCEEACNALEENHVEKADFSALAEAWFWGNCNVPLFFSRQSYTINTSIYRFLSQYSDDPNYPHGQGYGPLPDFAESFEGASICLKTPSNLDAVVSDINSLCSNFLIAALSRDWKNYVGAIPLFGNSVVRRSAAPGAKRGAKPTGAKAEFFRSYPDGIPAELSGEAIAAELAEKGYPISGRQVLNYAKEIKGK